MKDAVYDTLILSDLHLGAEISRARDALDLLRSLRFRRLVLLGDIFADLNFRRLNKAHWQFLSYIRKLSNPRRGTQVIWVEGNHDEGLSEVMSHLVGVPVYRQFVWEYHGKRHIAIHGHQFDRFAVNNVFVSRIGEWIFHELQKLDHKSKKFVRCIDRLNTRWLRLSAKVARGALSYAKQGKAERIFCGHTHVAEEREHDGVRYYNSGGWIDQRCTYITIGEEGVQIHEYSGLRIDDCDPAKNEGRLLPKLLNSLCRQDYPRMRRTKVFLADAQSTDNTREIALSYSDRLNIEVIPGGLPSVGRNAGARKAESKYLLFLDADMELRDPSLIRRALDLAEKRNLHCVTTNIWCNNGTLRDHLLYIGNNIVQYGSVAATPFSTGMFMLFAKSEFDRLGGFHEGALYAEDYLLSKKVSNWRFGIVRGRVYTSNRRFRSMGHSRIVGLFLRTMFNTWNDDYFLRDCGYWRQKV